MWNFKYESRRKRFISNEEVELNLPNITETDVRKLINSLISDGWELMDTINEGDEVVYTLVKGRVKQRIRYNKSKHRISINVEE